jgi:hypothetical protein
MHVSASGSAIAASLVRTRMCGADWSLETARLFKNQEIVKS